MNKLQLSKNQWDKLAKLYEEGIGEEGDPLHERYIDPIIFEFLGKLKNGAILDAGCGNGYLFKKLEKYADRIIGIDSSKELLKFAKKKISRYKKSVIRHANLLKKLPLETASFDAVIANMVLQYLPILETFVTESSRVLKPQGMLIVTVDHPAHTLFLRAQELAGKKNEKFVTSGSYFKAQGRTKLSLWDKAILEYYHRPIGDYINPFTPSFHLERVSENTEDGEMPRILGLKWVKR